MLKWRAKPADEDAYERKTRAVRFTVHVDQANNKLHGIKIADIYSESVAEARAEALRFFIMMPYGVSVERAKDRLFRGPERGRPKSTPKRALGLRT